MDRYDEMTDEVLVAAYRAGDFAAMEHLCKKYQKVVSAYGKKFFIKGSEEQDVVQEGMVGLFKAIQDYDPQTQVSFSHFARLCISRQIYKAIEAADRKKNQPLNSYVSIFDSEDEEIPNRQIIENILADDVQNPENVWIDAEKTEQIVEQIIKNLSKMELEVFFYMVQGLDYHTIAVKMDKTEKNIDNAIQRIRQKVRRILA